MRKPPSEESFEARLAAAKRANAPHGSQGGTQGGSLGTAFRLSADLVSAVVAGAGLGWGLDWLLGTQPWFLLLFFFLGIAAGILNVIRTANAMNAAQQADAAALQILDEDNPGDNPGKDNPDIDSPGKSKQENGLEH
ncbi:MAG: AtpZ/AtpI family protein [Pseudomonadota bacterium]